MPAIFFCLWVGVRSIPSVKKPTEPYADPKVTHEARCITARQNAGVSNHKGEHSGVIGARAVITPERETVRQQGRRIKEPDEPMFTLTAQDKHGVTYNGLD